MKKGALSIETIIIIILALLVLIIVAASFTGGMRELFIKIGLIAKTTQEISLSEATAKCSQVCTDSPTAFCTTFYQIKDVGPRACKDISAACTC